MRHLRHCIVDAQSRSYKYNYDVNADDDADDDDDAADDDDDVHDIMMANRLVARFGLVDMVPVLIVLITSSIQQDVEQIVPFRTTY
ncbi:hypothetical protein DPMN_080681 [Dreissena polymorpha]|uniref:Uncharacterized protein n=1 Tax=Dreissena polymorpha TaxID=45954 RepID=A0A9D4BR55_DREPO|nr:hypothetical protein DPMN_080681 [Dreissena polymorpha]